MPCLTSYDMMKELRKDVDAADVYNWIAWRDDGSKKAQKCQYGGKYESRFHDDVASTGCAIMATWTDSVADDFWSVQPCDLTTGEDADGADYEMACVCQNNPPYSM